MLFLLVILVLAASAAAQQPGTPEYVQRDARNMADAYGRQTEQQLANPAYTQALATEHGEVWLQQLAQQLASPTRLALTPGNVFPGWNGGNPLRRGWAGTRGLRVPIAYDNRYGALIRGSVFAPLPKARDPYTRRRLRPRYPGVVITTGSIQGSERMYWWLAQDLAERGYVVMTYDVQGQGTSETLPHENEQVNALPFCNPLAPPRDGESFGCPGVPSQQDANFVFGTEDALDFFVSRRNPLRGLLNRRRLGIVGHSLGARAISRVQGYDRRVDAAVALDKLSGADGVKPRVPALAVQSEYGFTVQPYWLNHGSSIAPRPAPPTAAPDPRREQKTGFDAWRAAGRDTLLIVPRASTHLDYTDIAYVLPASRWGQALTSVYVQRWLDRYLKGRSARPLLAERFRYLEPVDVGRWEPVTLERSRLLSFYFCSGYSTRRLGADTDLGC